MSLTGEEEALKWRGGAPPLTAIHVILDLRNEAR